MSELSSESGLNEYEVTAIEHSDIAVGGGEANVHVVKAESEEVAERSVKEKPGVKRVEENLTIERQTNDEGRNVY